MPNYYAGEVALTPATKKLWAKRHENLLPLVKEEKSSKTDSFQQTRIFSIVRRDGSA